MRPITQVNNLQCRSVLYLLLVHTINKSETSAPTRPTGNNSNRQLQHSASLWIMAKRFLQEKQKNRFFLLCLLFCLYNHFEQRLKISTMSRYKCDCVVHTAAHCKLSVSVSVIG